MRKTKLSSLVTASLLFVGAIHLANAEPMPKKESKIPIRLYKKRSQWA
ncbi:MAG: hypothetical protein P8Y49_05555 [Sulfurovaceae bacterium]